MTENNKPEWFEIAELDESAVPRRSTKKLPLAAVLATALVLGVGAVIAQTQEEPPANAVEKNSNQTVKPTAGSTANESVAPTHATIATATAKPSATASALQNPSIASLPTKGGDDHDEGEERSRHGEHHDDEGDDD